MLGLGGVPSAIQFIGLLLLPESPRWLVTQGKEAQARQVLSKLRRGAEDLDSAVEAEMDDILASLALAAASRSAAAPTGGVDGSRASSGGAAAGRSSTRVVIPSDASAAAEAAPTAIQPAASDAAATTPAGGGSGVGGIQGDGAYAGGRRRASGSGASLSDLWAVRRQLVLGVGLLTLQQLIGINTIMYYSVSILVQAHVGTVQQSIWLAVPVASAQLVGCLIGGAMIDRMGRRPLALFSLCGAAIALALEGGAFMLDASLCTHANATAPAYAAADADAPAAVQWLCDAKSYVTVGAMVLYLLCFGVGMSPVPWAINAEIYPLHVRAACVSIATSANWITNFIVAATFLSLQDALGKPGTFWLYGGVAVFGAIWLCVSMPETAGRSLEQIERLFELGPRRRYL